MDGASRPRAREQAKGLTLYTTRTILWGRADEVIELATTNLRGMAKE